jgi:dephospho-CoA kinase
MIIGLTGGIGSGKSAVANFFNTIGINTIDADSLAKNALNPDSPGYKQFINTFGLEYIGPDKKINNSKLRQEIFINNNLKTSLEKIVHPIVRNNIAQLISSSNSPYHIVEVPLIYETNSSKNYDRVLVVDCNEDLQIKRASKRDSANEDEIRNIMQNQATRSQRLSIADDIIDNGQSIESLQNAVTKMHNFYLNLLKESS